MTESLEELQRIRRRLPGRRGSGLPPGPGRGACRRSPPPGPTAGGGAGCCGTPEAFGSRPGPLGGGPAGRGLRGAGPVFDLRSGDDGQSGGPGGGEPVVFPGGGHLHRLPIPWGHLPGSHAALGSYELAEGYTLLHREDFGTWVEMVYADEHTGQTLQFCYQRLSTGGGWSLTNRNITRTEVSVRGLPGHLYTAQEGSSHTLVWFDQESGYSFLLSARLPVEGTVGRGRGSHPKRDNPSAAF